MSQYRMDTLHRAQLKLLIKRSERLQVYLHNNDCKDSDTLVDLIADLDQQQNKISELVKQFGYSVSWPGIDPLFTDITTGREHFTTDNL